MLIVSARDGRLLRREPDGSPVTHADLSGLAGTGRPWNEIVVDGRGNAYLNNLGFDFPAGKFVPGTIALLTRDGSARQVADGIAFPNGMAVTSDNSTLIVAESYASTLAAFEIAADGSLTNRRTWADLPGDHPDGICLDADGAVWYADVGNKHCVRVREGGEVLQTIELDRGCFACMLGGEDGRTLFNVAQEWGGSENTQTGERTGQLSPSRSTRKGIGPPARARARRGPRADAGDHVRQARRRGIRVHIRVARDGDRPDQPSPHPRRRPEAGGARVNELKRTARG